MSECEVTPVQWILPSDDPSVGGSAMSNQRFSPEFKDEAVREPHS